MKIAQQSGEYQREFPALIAYALIYELLRKKERRISDYRFSCRTDDRLIDLFLGPEVTIDVTLADITFAGDHLKRCFFISSPDE